MAVPRSGLIAEYTMDSINGSTLTDTSDAGGHDGTITGATVQTGIIGNALQFDNANAGASPTYYVTIANTLILSGSYSLSAWVKDTYSATPLALMSYDVSSYEAIFSCSNGALRIRRNGSDYYSTSNNPTLINNWYHLIVRFDASTNYVQWWVNGSKLGNDVSIPVDGFTFDLIGAQRVAASLYNHAKGYHDQLRVYNRYVTDQEIADLYAEYTPPTQINPTNIKSETRVADPWSVYPKSIYTLSAAKKPEIYPILGPGQEIVPVIGNGELLSPACDITAYGNFGAEITLEEQTLSASGKGTLIAAGDLVCEPGTVEGFANSAALLILEEASLAGTGYHETIGECAASQAKQLLAAMGFPSLTGVGELNLKKEKLSAVGTYQFANFSAKHPRQRLNGLARAGNAGNADLNEPESTLAAFGFSDIEADVICYHEQQSLHGHGSSPNRFNQVFLSH